MSHTIIRHTPCTLLTGFLGSGKTTLINQLLSLKLDNDRWALLINEFGQIGIDASLIDYDQTATDHSIAIREVSGGCICCTSQLPLQIALARLLADHHPAQLLIEPTGLAHPKTLLQQLSEAHWQTSLSLKSVICVISALQWQQRQYRNHKGYQSHVKYADVVVVNRYQHLAKQDSQQLTDWINEINPHTTVLWMPSQSHYGTALLKSLNSALQQPSQVMSRLKQSSSQQVRIALSQHLSPSLPINHPTLNNSDNSAHIPNQDGADHLNQDLLPYRYHDHQQGMMVGGWRLPPEWQLNAEGLQSWLLTLPDWQRIKGVVHTTEGWLRLNFTPDCLKVTSTEPQIDSRLEIILNDLNHKFIIDNDHAIKQKGFDLNQVSNSSKLLNIDRQHCWENWDHHLMSLIQA